MVTQIRGKRFQMVPVVGHKVYYLAGCKVVETLDEARRVCKANDFDESVIELVVAAVGSDDSYEVAAYC